MSAFNPVAAPLRKLAAPNGVVLLVLLAAFGPYVLPGIRTEQIVVYLCAAVLFFRLDLRSVPRPLVLVAGLWTLFATLTLVVGVIPQQAPSQWPFGSYFAGADAVLMPLAVMVIGYWVAERQDPRVTLQFFCWVLMVIMLLNSVAAWGQTVGLASWGPWWGDVDGWSVALNAEGNGRFSGLINQPAEAGALYGAAILGAVHVLRQRPVFMLLACAVLFYGGLMTVSKIFLYVALPIVVVQICVLFAHQWKRLVGLAAGVAVAIGLAMAGLFPTWAGGNQVSQIVPSGGSISDIIGTLTASRVGSGSTLAPVIEAVMALSPVVGFGAVGLQVPYDNGLLEALIYGGLVGVLLVSAIGVVLLVTALKMDRSVEKVYYLALVALLAGGIMGLPILTANRVATCLWLVLTLLIVLASPRPRTEEAVLLAEAPHTVHENANTERTADQ